MAPDPMVIKSVPATSLKRNVPHQPIARETLNQTRHRVSKRHFANPRLQLPNEQSDAGSWTTRRARRHPRRGLPSKNAKLWPNAVTGEQLNARRRATGDSFTDIPRSRQSLSRLLRTKKLCGFAQTRRCETEPHVTENHLRDRLTRC
jgi:hypothetical protein